MRQNDRDLLKVGKSDHVAYVQDAAYLPSSTIGVLIAQLSKNRIKQRNRTPGLKHYYLPVELFDAKFSRELVDNKDRLTSLPHLEVAEWIINTVHRILQEIARQQPDDPALPEYRNPTFFEILEKSMASRFLKEAYQFYTLHSGQAPMPRANKASGKSTLGGVPSRGPGNTIVTGVDGKPLSGHGSPPIVGTIAQRLHNEELRQYRENNYLPTPMPNAAPNSSYSPRAMNQHQPVHAVYDVNGESVGIDVAKPNAIPRILMHAFAAQARGEDPVAFLNHIGAQVGGIAVTNDLDPSGDSLVHIFDQSAPAPAADLSADEGITIGARKGES